MSLETGNYISDLVATNPTGTDPKSQGDDHLRLVKDVLKKSFPLVDGPLTASMVPFVQSGTSGGATTVQDKLVEYVSLKDFGAVGDGVADDTVALNDSQASLYTVLGPPGTFKSTATVNLSRIKSNSKSTFTSNQLYSFGVASDTDVDGGFYDTTGGVVFNTAAGAANWRIQNTITNNRSVSDATSFNINSASAADFFVLSNTIKAIGYGVLVSFQATNAEGGIVALNNIQVDDGDAIALNSPGTTTTSMVVIGNVLETKPSGTAINAGFAFSIAATKGVAVVGNAVKGSRQEAFHYEDSQHTNVLVGNTALECGGPGLIVLESTSANSEGFPAVGNSFRASSGNTHSGILLNYDVNGSTAGMSVVGNKVSGFTKGISVSSADSIVSDNVIANAATCGIYSDGGGQSIGTNMLIGCSTLARTKKSAVIGKLVSTTSPTTILDTSEHVAGTLGSVVRGFALPRMNVPIAAASADNLAIVCPLPKLMRGRIIARAVLYGASSSLYFSVDIGIDSGTLAMQFPLKEAIGVFDLGALNGFQINGGNLVFNLYNAGGASTADFYFDFDGEYYK